MHGLLPAPGRDHPPSPASPTGHAPAGRAITGVLLPWLAVLAFAMAAGVWARVTAPERLEYQVWSDRDLSRAAETLERPWFTGAEFDRGGRTPGGAFYLLLRLAIAANGPHPVDVHAVSAVLDVLGMIALGVAAWRHAGPGAGLAAAAFYATAPAVLQHTRFIAYNPTHALPFGCFAYAFFLEALCARRAWALAAAFACAGLAAQMHFSFAILVPLFLLALAVRRAWPGARVVGGALLAFLLTYAPYLAAEARAGWPNTREIAARQHVVAAPRAPWVAPGAPLVHSLPRLGEVLLEIRTPVPRRAPLTLGSWTIERFPPWRVFPVYLAAILALAVLRPGTARGLRSGPRAVGIAMLVVIGAGVALLGLRNTSFVTRYILFLAPAVALALGCGLQAYLDVIRGTRAVLVLAANAFFAYWAFMFLHGNALWWGATLSDPRVRVETWRSVMGELQTWMGFSQRDLLERVTVVDQAEGRIALVGPVEAAPAYLVRLFAQPRASSAGDRCALVLLAPKTADPLTPDHLRAALGVLPAERAVLDLQRVPAPHPAQIFSYRLAGGGCYHNVNSRYVLTPEEELIRDARLPTQGSGAVAIPAAGETRYAGIVHGRDPGAWPFRFLVGLRHGPEGVVATLHSNELRGYDGLSAFRATGTALLLHGPAGTRRVPVFEGTLGGWFGAALTPWTSGPWPVPPGTYQVELAIDDLAFAQTGPGEGPRRIALPGAFVVPGP